MTADKRLPKQVGVLGLLLKELRQAANLTREQLSAETGLTPFRIAQLESGRLSVRPWILNRLARSRAMFSLRDRALERRIPIVSADLGVAAAIDSFVRQNVASRTARKQLRGYFAGTLTEELGDLTSERLAVPFPAETSRLVLAFLDWCTLKGLIESNPIRHNGSRRPWGLL
jgi:DNA-binding XRE family transcriptional regulator